MTEKPRGTDADEQRAEAIADERYAEAEAEATDRQESIEREHDYGMAPQLNVIWDAEDRVEPNHRDFIRALAIRLSVYVPREELERIVADLVETYR